MKKLVIAFSCTLTALCLIGLFIHSEVNWMYEKESTSARACLVILSLIAGLIYSFVIADLQKEQLTDRSKNQL